MRRLIHAGSTQQPRRAPHLLGITMKRPWLVAFVALEAIGIALLIYHIINAKTHRL